MQTGKDGLILLFVLSFFAIVGFLPDIPHCERAPGTPCFRKRIDFAAFGNFAQIKHFLQLFLEDKVGTRYNVCAAQSQQQKHFDGPLAEAADLHQLLGNLAVGHIIELIHGYAAVDHCIGKAAQEINILLNKTDAEQVLGGRR